MIVTTPDWTTSSKVLSALPDLRRRLLGDKHLSLVINKIPTGRGGDTTAIEERFRHHQVARQVAIPYNEQLHTMLDTGTYALEGLPRSVRVPIKQLGLTLAEQLV